ncbi:MAG: hypothetical protein OEM81_03470 [Acidimicrobiia bacterium]|nr:hypothetical protein [Acidimicrobiia bacterium]
MAVVSALIMVLGGCGGDTEATTDGSASADPTATSDAPDGSEPETLAEFFGWIGGDDPAAAQAQFQEQETKIQELVRLCMAEQGFEYIPATQPVPDFEVTFDQEEYAREQGFGITTWFGNEEQFFGGPEADWVDPNQVIVEAMSESEQEAYYEALYGPPDFGTPEVDEESGETYYVSEGFGGGCQGKAAEEVYGNEGGQQLWEVFQPELEAMYERVQSDPRIVAANEEWSACMGDRGYDYESMDDMYMTVFEELQKRFEEIVGPNGGYADPFEGWTEDEINVFFEEKTPEEVDAYFQQAQADVKQDVDQAALAALQQEEIDLAVAAAECSHDVDDLYMEVSNEYEAEFIVEHRAELEALRDND